MSYRDMTDEQEQTIEAITLARGGFTTETPCRLMHSGDGGVFVVMPNGDLYEMPLAFKITSFRRFMADTYGRGATP